MKKNAFTLAEVLITLGIIGVVAALVMPSLIADYRERAAVTRLKKVYSVLSNAYNLAKEEYGDADTWTDGQSTLENDVIVFNNLKPYLNIVKDCGYQGGCFKSAVISKLNGQPSGLNYGYGWQKFMLADGTSVLLQATSSGVLVMVDIDGPGGANTYGKDIFAFNITSEGVVPAGLFQDMNSVSCNIKGSATGSSCTAWVVVNGNMDYLHCNNLSWDGPIKCN